MIALRMFVAGILLLLRRQISNVASVTIDVEYEGKEGEIKGVLLQFILNWVPDFPKGAITFQRIGKKSSAHKLAWETHRSNRKPDHVATLDDLLLYC
ncbi:MAG: hypothetical protein AB1345_04710 [Chloroflexota bacterium]